MSRNAFIIIIITIIFSPGYTKEVAGEGMPVSGEPGKKGNLIIEFDIQFPQVMTPEKKQLIRKALL